MRMMLEAEGERRMMGSGLREGFLRFETRAGLLVGGVVGMLGVGPGARWRRKRAVCLRTWEKSWI